MINHDKSIWLIDVDRLTESAIAGWSRQYCSRSEYSGIMRDGCTLPWPMFINIPESVEGTTGTTYTI